MLPDRYNQMKVLVTGAAGFIGFHTAAALLDRGDEIIGVDNMSPYYDVSLKRARLARLEDRDHFQFVLRDLADREATSALFAEVRPDRVVHLAAQAGVRPSLTDPHAYVDANLVGFVNILEGCRHNGVGHLVYASSSSVYGANARLPYSVTDNVDHPLSLYAVTKKSNELMAHAYAHLFGLPVTGLRFFTVYGPWGRPDMAPFIFTRKILAGEPIDVFGEGRHARDFTYIDDVVEGVVRTLDHIPSGDPDGFAAAPDPSRSAAPYGIHNIGNGRPVELLDFIARIEEETGRAAQTRMLPAQPGDVPSTAADITSLREAVGFSPKIGIEEGMRRFVAWYRSFYLV